MDGISSDPAYSPSSALDFITYVTLDGILATRSTHIRPNQSSRNIRTVPEYPSAKLALSILGPERKHLEAIKAGLGYQ
jgi:hypothetical protein